MLSSSDPTTAFLFFKILKTYIILIVMRNYDNSVLDGSIYLYLANYCQHIFFSELTTVYHQPVKKVIINFLLLN